MRCPGCNNLENKVVDSRLTKDGHIIRRRRECLDCNSRFTTYERIEELLPLVIKKDNRREPFDRMKILNGVQKACEKRPVSVEEREQLVDRVIKIVQECGYKEIQSELIGENLMKELYSLDKIAYVRFASVYRSFKDINEFMSELKDLLKDKKTN